LRTVIFVMCPFIVVLIPAVAGLWLF